MKVLVGIPVLDNVYHRFFLHTSGFLGRLVKDGLDVELHIPNRMAIDRSRQLCVDMAIASKADRLIFIDDDTLIPIDAFHPLEAMLQRSEKVISASGVSFQRGFPYMPMIYRFPDFDWAKSQLEDLPNQLIPPFPSEPFRVSANGMGVSMLKVELLKEIEGDCFGRVGPGTEDFYFYKKVWDKGFEAWANANIIGVHIGDRVEITPDNAPEYRRGDVSEWTAPEAVKEEVRYSPKDHSNFDDGECRGWTKYLPEEAGGRGSISHMTMQHKEPDYGSRIERKLQESEAIAK
jgi:hypothetical protein